MLFPIMNEVSRYREMTTTFGGYNHSLSCGEGEFYDMQNMTSKHFPVLSPRGKRRIIKNDSDIIALVNKNGLMWVVDDYPARLEYIIKQDNGIYKKGMLELPDSCIAEQMVSMGAYVVIFPDNIWIDTSKEPFEWGYMGAYYGAGSTTGTQEVKFTLANENGKVVEWKDEDYYETNAPKNGDYAMSTVNGKAVLKVYSSATSIWSTVGTTYVQIKANNIGRDFKKGDGVTIRVKDDGTWNYLSTLFLNDDGDGYRSINAVIKDRTDDSIVITGIINQEITLTDADLSVERKVPEMEFITECNNRLWGCSLDGHEIYCCKLGDMKNWYVYEGVSTDSWAVTIGSDGKFTGAITYMGYPMFFKEDGFVKISVSSTGGHQVRETKCRGVQDGSGKSLAIVNETLYYKASSSVVAYNGSLPFSISDNLGEVRYSDAVAGTIGDRYYISMKDEKGEYSLFVFDQKTGIWTREDDTQVSMFCGFKNDLFFVEKKLREDGLFDLFLKSVNGTQLHDIIESEEEGRVEWYAESGNIGYSSPDNKYVSRINIRITLEAGTNVDFYLQYDSDEQWEHKFNMSGKGTKTFTIPVIPKRCDHFKYKIQGKGGCKIHSITKTIEQGSDI